MRTYEESCALLDSIVGRCIREADFAARVIADPEAALVEYQLDEDELDDFRSLKARHSEEALETWTAIRTGVARVRARQQQHA